MGSGDGSTEQRRRVQQRVGKGKRIGRGRGWDRHHGRPPLTIIVSATRLLILNSQRPTGDTTNAPPPKPTITSAWHGVAALRLTGVDHKNTFSNSLATLEFLDNTRRYSGKQARTNHAAHDAPSRRVQLKTGRFSCREKQNKTGHAHGQRHQYRNWKPRTNPVARNNTGRSEAWTRVRDKLISQRTYIWRCLELAAVKRHSTLLVHGSKCVNFSTTTPIPCVPLKEGKSQGVAVICRDNNYGKQDVFYQGRTTNLYTAPF